MRNLFNWWNCTAQKNLREHLIITRKSMAPYTGLYGGWFWWRLWLQLGKTGGQRPWCWAVSTGPTKDVGTSWVLHVLFLTVWSGICTLEAILSPFDEELGWCCSTTLSYFPETAGKQSVLSSNTMYWLHVHSGGARLLVQPEWAAPEWAYAISSARTRTCSKKN